MLPLPTEIIQVLAAFAPAFSERTFAKAQVLVCGALLAPGRRTVAAALRAVGLGGDPHFGNYHRVLNRDCWYPWLLSRSLLGLLVTCLVPAGMPLLIVIDETLERRRGRKLRYKGIFYDAVRSTPTHKVASPGIRWVCVALLVPLPWSQRLWALPFMVVPALSSYTSAKLHKAQRTPVQWAILMLKRIRRWQPERDLIVLADGNYAAIELVKACQQASPAITLLSRLRLDAQLYDPPAVRPAGRRGPAPKKGARQPQLGERLADPHTGWETAAVSWYSNAVRRIQLTTATALWHRSGQLPVPLRWVLLRCPPDAPKGEQFKPAALLCSNPGFEAEQIVHLYILRWNIEITFAELRSCLGFETQRQWSDRAVERTTPCLCGLFSFSVLIAKLRHGDHLPVRQTPWYPKPEATFSDVLAAVRYDIWHSWNCTASPDNLDLFQLPTPLAQALLETACYST